MKKERIIIEKFRFAKRSDSFRYKMKCFGCQNVFILPPNQFNRGRGLFCSHSCYMKNNKDEKASHWKGDKIGYRALHKWVEGKLGKPRFCENCGERNLKHRQYHWSNISRTYKRIITDWQRLCVKCHKKYDG